MPVDISALHPMLQGLMAGLQRQQQQEEFASTMEQRQQEFEANAKHAQNVLKQQAEHNKALTDLEARRVQLEEDTKQLTGNKIIQDAVLHGQDPRLLGRLVDPNNPQGQRTYGGVTYDPNQFATPTQYGTAEGQVEAAKNIITAPSQYIANLFKSKGEAAGTAAITQPNLMARMAQEQTNALALEKAKDAAAFARTKYASDHTYAADIYGADKRLEGVKLGIMAPTTDEFRDNILPSIMVGNRSEEEIKRLYPKAAASIENAANSAGVKVLNKDIVENKLPGLVKMSRIGEIAEQYTDALKKDGLRAFAPGSVSADLANKLTAYKGNLARDVSGETRNLTDHDIARVNGLFGTKGELITNPSEIDRKLGEFWENYNNSMKQYLNGASEAQVNALQRKYPFDRAGKSKSRGRYYFQRYDEGDQNAK